MNLKQSDTALLGEDDIYYYISRRQEEDFKMPDSEKKTVQIHIAQTLQSFTFL